MIIIDANNAILGRLASHAAKRALLGDEVKIINCENAIISGNPVAIQKKYLHKRNRGQAIKGPYYPRQPDKFVRRIVRGMLPFNTARGQQVFRNIMCYSGAPAGLDKAQKLKFADAEKLPNHKQITVGHLCKWLGATQ